MNSEDNRSKQSAKLALRLSRGTYAQRQFEFIVAPFLSQCPALSTVLSSLNNNIKDWESIQGSLMPNSLS